MSQFNVSGQQETAESKIHLCTPLHKVHLTIAKEETQKSAASGTDEDLNYQQILAVN